MAGRESEKPPAWLTTPEAALAERAAWEADFEKLLTEALREHLAEMSEPTSLTAAAFPNWLGALGRIIQRLPELPRWLVDKLSANPPEIEVDPETGEEPTPAEIAKKLAPTLSTAAYNEFVLNELAAYGMAYKEWVTRQDTRVRPTHVEAAGQTVALSQPFIVGGAMLQFPGDWRTAPIHEWIGCRCTIVGKRNP